MKKYILTIVVALLLSVMQLNAQENVIILPDIEMSGIEMQTTMNEDGTDIIQRPFKWFSGIAKADDRQLAVEIATREAYATISRVLMNNVNDKCERATLAIDGKVAKAVKSYWLQVSETITKGCEPYGKASVTYNTETKMYEVTAKVAVRGDRYLKLLGEAKEAKPEGLNAAETQEFIEINAAIIDAAKED